MQGAHFVLLALALSAAPLNAAIPNIPPAMVAQLKNMSPAQQAALARQYGIEIPGAGGVGGVDPQSSTVGQPGEEIDAFERVQRMQLEQEIRETIAEEDGEELEEELKRFGLELFDREISTFAPVDDLPAPDGYLMGPGDTVNVYMFGSEEADLGLSVTRDGQLLLPRLGPITVTGLTFSEVKRLIEGKVASQLVGTDVVVSMGKLRAIDIFLAGDVYAPGSYSVSGLSTVLQALYAGGGITEIGSLRDIQVKRRGELVGRLDAYDVLLRGDTSNDMRLASGDTVFVPTVNRLVTIDGEVKRPAIYEILSSDTLGDLLKMAGG
jgi:polysaccharide export outer membrane protein